MTIGEVAVAAALDAQRIPVLDRMLVRAELEVAAHGLEVSLAHGGAERVHVVHLAAGALERGADGARRVVALAA